MERNEFCAVGIYPITVAELESCFITREWHDIEINLKEAKTIRIEEGEIYQINILLSNTKEAMEPGAYAPETEKKPLIKT